jgi:hypothetical protein
MGASFSNTPRAPASAVAPRPETPTSGANEHLDFLGQVIYKRETSGKVAGEIPIHLKGNA